MFHAPSYHTGVFASTSAGAGGALLWVWDQLARHGPGWGLVPPLLLSVASLVGAYWSGRKMAQDLRQSAELHAAHLARLRAGLAPHAAPPAP